MSPPRRRVPPVLGPRSRLGSAASSWHHVCGTRLSTAGLGERAFLVAAVRVWNELLRHVTPVHDFLKCLWSDYCRRRCWLSWKTEFSAWPCTNRGCQRPSAQPITTQRCVCRTRPRCTHIHAYACAVSSLCPVYFSSPATLHLRSTTLAIPSQPTHTGRKSVDQWSSYRRSGRTDSSCCYECYECAYCHYEALSLS